MRRRVEAGRFLEDSGFVRGGGGMSDGRRNETMLDLRLPKEGMPAREQKAWDRPGRH